MQDVLIEKPYQFVPPITARWPQRVLTALGRYRPVLKNREGVVAHECRHLERLRESMAAGHGIMLTPNHPRTADPISMFHVARETPCPLYMMASWHLFNGGRLERFMVRLMGGFSVNREGLDRSSIDFAIKVLASAERPLLIFAEGATSRTNDQLMALMDGPAFIARTAAKRRAKRDGGKVVVHPVAIKYLFQGDLEVACNPVLTEIEQQLTWRPDPSVPLLDRIIKIGNALLTLKELQYHVSPLPGATLRQRQSHMVDSILHPLENEWLGRTVEAGIATRIKNLRMKIFPEMSRSEIDIEERNRRWTQLETTYLAQQIDCYPDRYITELRSVDRILETVEKFEEDLRDKCRLHGQLKVVLEMGEAIEVSPERDRAATVDPLMAEIRSQLESSLARLQHESRVY
jgi:hypothetical protein